MAQPIHHNAAESVVSEAEAGVSRGILGAIAGGAVAVAAVAGIAALVASGAGALGLAAAFNSSVGAFATGGALIGAAVSFFTPVPYVGAAIGGGAGAVGGIARRSTRLAQDNQLARQSSAGHAIQKEAQMAEMRAQVAEQYAQMGYAQGLQDGQMAMMQQLQAAAQQQQQAANSNEHPGENSKRIAAELGMDAGTVQTASQVEKLAAKNEKTAGEASLST